MGSNIFFSKITADVFPPWHCANTYLNAPADLPTSEISWGWSINWGVLISTTWLRLPWLNLLSLVTPFWFILLSLSIWLNLIYLCYIFCDFIMQQSLIYCYRDWECFRFFLSACIQLSNQIDLCCTFRILHLYLYTKTQKEWKAVISHPFTSMRWFFKALELYWRDEKPSFSSFEAVMMVLKSEVKHKVSHRGSDGWASGHCEDHSTNH